MVLANLCMVSLIALVVVIGLAVSDDDLPDSTTKQLTPVVRETARHSEADVECVYVDDEKVRASAMPPGWLKIPTQRATIARSRTT